MYLLGCNAAGSTENEAIEGQLQSNNQPKEPAYPLIRIDSSNIHQTLRPNELAVFMRTKTQAFILLDRNGQKRAFQSFESLLESIKAEISQKEVTALSIWNGNNALSNEALDEMLRLMKEKGLKCSLLRNPQP